MTELDLRKQQIDLKATFARGAVSSRDFDVSGKANLIDIVTGLQHVGNEGDTSHAPISGVPVSYTVYSVGDYLAKGVERLVGIEYTKRLGSGRTVEGVHIIRPTDNGVQAVRVLDTNVSYVDAVDMKPTSPALYIAKLIGEPVQMAGTPAGRIESVRVSIFQRGASEAEEAASAPLPGRRTKVGFLSLVK